MTLIWSPLFIGHAWIKEQMNTASWVQWRGFLANQSISQSASQSIKANDTPLPPVKPYIIKGPQPPDLPSSKCKAKYLSSYLFIYSFLLNLILIFSSNFSSPRRTFYLFLSKMFYIGILQRIHIQNYLSTDSCLPSTHVLKTENTKRAFISASFQKPPLSSSERNSRANEIIATFVVVSAWQLRHISVDLRAQNI